MAVNGIGYGYYGNSYGINNISALYRKQLQNAARVNRSSAVRSQQLQICRGFVGSVS